MRGFWGRWGSLRENHGNAFPRFAAKRLGPFLPRAATRRAAAGRARKAPWSLTGIDSGAKGFLPPQKSVMSPEPRSF